MPHLLDLNADELQTLIGSLEPQETTPEEKAELLAQVPAPDPEAPVTVVTSLRLPYELKQRVDEAGEAEGMSTSPFIRHALERVLASRG